jgi:hypothetical protein
MYFRGVMVLAAFLLFVGSLLLFVFEQSDEPLLQTDDQLE